MGKNVAFFPHPNWKYKIKSPRHSRFSGAEFTRCDVMTSVDPTEDETSGNPIKNCKNQVQTGMLYKMEKIHGKTTIPSTPVFQPKLFEQPVISGQNSFAIKWVKEQALQTLCGAICRRSCGLYHVWLLQILSAWLLRQEWLIESTSVNKCAALLHTSNLENAKTVRETSATANLPHTFTVYVSL